MPCEVVPQQTTEPSPSLSYNAWLSTSCEWQSRTSYPLRPASQGLEAIDKWQSSEEKHTGATGWVRMSPFTGRSWRKSSFEVSDALYHRSKPLIFLGSSSCAHAKQYQTGLPDRRLLTANTMCPVSTVGLINPKRISEYRSHVTHR
jgi:hypothetical protein